MRHGLLVFGAVGAVAVLGGCAGGSNSIPAGATGGMSSVQGTLRGTEAHPPASTAATPKPTATPVVYPLTPGDAFTYQYSLLTTVKTSTSYKITQSFTGVVTSVLGGLGAYNGVPAYALRTTGATSTGTATLDHIDYVNVVSAGGHLQYEEYGNNYGDVVNLTNGVFRHDNVITAYAKPIVYDILPETGGASWSEPVGLTETINDYYTTSQNNPNILSGTETEGSDGSYNASGKVFDVPETRQLRSNGTGSITDGPASGSTTWSFGLPVVQAGHKVIPATEAYAGKSATNFVPDWYPGGVPSSPLATASRKDLGSVKAPSTCGKQSGATATHLQSTAFALDPVEGSITSEVRDDYVVPGVGFVCTLDALTQQAYNTENSGALVSTKKTTTSQILTSEVLK